MLRLAAPIGTFARFQAGFLVSEDFHRISKFFMDFHRYFKASPLPPAPLTAAGFLAVGLLHY